jgi:hypothetical protein
MAARSDDQTGDAAAVSSRVRRRKKARRSLVSLSESSPSGDDDLLRQSFSSPQRRRYTAPVLAPEVVFTFEVSEVEPEPFDDSRLRVLIIQNWLLDTNAGEALFAYYSEIARNERLDVPALGERTMALLAQVQRSTTSDEPSVAFAYFTSLHHFFSLLSAGAEPCYETVCGEIQHFVSTAFLWELELFGDTLAAHFSACFAGLDLPATKANMLRFRELFKDSIGQFVWGHLVRAADCKLANQLLDPARLQTLKALVHARELFINLCGLMNFKMTYFLQSLNFLISYEKIIRDSTPFEQVAPDLPMSFIVAIVFTAKIKGIVPLTVSDKRILAVADSACVDLSLLEAQTLAISEPNLVVPAVL